MPTGHRSGLIHFACVERRSGIDPAVRPGYGPIRCIARIRGDGTVAQFREIHDSVLRTSPNHFNVSQPVAVDADLVVMR